MKIGIFGIGSGASADPDIAISLAQHADVAGIESMWTGEHVVLPSPRQAPSPAAPEFPMLHPSTVLSYLASVTEKILLGTGILLLAQRNPLVVAKEMASLDQLSKGRLVMGIGAGYLHQEFSALGIPFSERGARCNEYIEVLKTMWYTEKPSFSGRFFNFDNIDAQPRPYQSPIPIVVGGSSTAALVRSATYAQGWYGFALSVEQTEEVLGRMKRIDGGSALEISVTPPGRVDAEMIEAYHAIGVHRIISLIPQDLSQAQRTIDTLLEANTKVFGDENS